MTSTEHIEATRAMASAYRDAAAGHKDIAKALGDATRASTCIGDLLGETDNTGIHILLASELDRQAWHHAETAVILSHAAEALMESAQLRSAALRMVGE